MTSMKLTTFLFSIGLVFTMILSACNPKAGSSSSDVSLETKTDSISYSMGFKNGQFMQQRGMTDINLDKLVAGMRAGLNEQEAQLSDAQMQQLIQEFRIKAQQQAQKMRIKEAKENLAEGKAFLAENKEKEGVQTTESGLQYKVLQEGSGVSPDSTDVVRVHYEGTLLDGTVFDSSYERGEPISFPLDQVISGWTEGVQLMQEGAKYKFWIPAGLAYGRNPRPGGPIGPNETLIFTVELLEVNPDSASE